MSRWLRTRWRSRCSPLAPVLKTEIPGIKDFSRVIVWGKGAAARRRGKTVATGTLLGTDASFIDLLGLSLLKGPRGTALKEPNSIVITQTMARNLFGDSDPMGQTIRHEGRDTFTFRVTGILADLPRQSHLQFDALYSLSTVVRPDWNKNWESEWTFTYLGIGGAC